MVSEHRFYCAIKPYVIALQPLIVMCQSFILSGLPRNQTHWDKWPTEFEKGGPFQKVWVPGKLPHMMPMVYQHLDKLDERTIIRLFIMCAFKYLQSLF